MKNKNFSSKFEETKVDNKPDTEFKLLPRLKFLGYVMSIIAVATLTFAIVVPEESEITAELLQHEHDIKKNNAGLLLDNDEDILEFDASDVLNFYMISAVFAAIGATCFVIAWKKRKDFLISDVLNTKK